MGHVTLSALISISGFQVFRSVLLRGLGTRIRRRFSFDGPLIHSPEDYEVVTWMSSRVYMFGVTSKISYICG